MLQVVLLYFMSGQLPNIAGGMYFNALKVLWCFGCRVLPELPKRTQVLSADNLGTLVMTIEINDKSAGNGLDGEFMVDSTKWDRFSHF